MSNLNAPGKQMQCTFPLGKGTGSVWLLDDDGEIHSYAYADAEPGISPGTGADAPTWVKELSLQLNSDINTYNTYLLAANRESKQGNRGHKAHAYVDKISALLNGMTYLENLVWPPATTEIPGDDTHYVSSLPPQPPFTAKWNGGKGQVTLYADRFDKKSWGFITNFSISWTVEPLADTPTPPSSSSLLYASSSGYSSSSSSVSPPHED